MKHFSAHQKTASRLGHVVGSFSWRHVTVTWAAGLCLAAAVMSARQVEGAELDRSAPVTEAADPHARQPAADCFECLLGIFDDTAMTSNRGTMTPLVPKDIYVGIQFDAGFTELTGIEFSIAGIRQVPDGIFLLSTEPLVPTPIVIGSVPSPEDTSSTSTGTGGMNVAWSSCLVGSQALLRLTLLTLAPISNHVIEVKRRYPAPNPNFRTPLFVQCDEPAFSKVRVMGGCYGINVSAGPLPCDVVVGVERTTWSQVKALYD